jgi:hypothetical protein
MHDFQSLCQITTPVSISMYINSIKRFEKKKITEFKELNKCVEKWAIRTKLKN